MLSLEPGFFRQEVTQLARLLIGVRLLVGSVGGLIVETEAYDSFDPASHSFAGLTKRNRTMFGPPGRAYIYRIYGLHWCLNVVGGEAPGEAVLIRAIEPTDGLDQMRSRRSVEDVRQLCSGPGKLCQALAITGEHDGLLLNRAPFDLAASSGEPPIVRGPRIGISKAASTPWRFGMRGSAFLSRPFAGS